MLLSDYDRVVCITTDIRYYEHASRIKSLLLEHGVNLNRISFFVNGKGTLLPEQFYQQILLDSDVPKDFTYNYGYYAVSRAFQSVIQSALESGANSLLVLEDDCLFVPDFDAVLNEANSQLESLPPWDLLYYGANHTQAQVKELSSNVLRCKTSFMTHCIGIHQSIMQRLVELPITASFDIMLAHGIQHSCRCYAIWPSIAIQLPGYSCIDGCYKDLTEVFQSKGDLWKD